MEMLPGSPHPHLPGWGQAAWGHSAAHGRLVCCTGTPSRSTLTFSASQPLFMCSEEIVSGSQLPISVILGPVIPHHLLYEFAKAALIKIFAFPYATVLLYAPLFPDVQFILVSEQLSSRNLLACFSHCKMLKVWDTYCNGVVDTEKLTTLPLFSRFVYWFLAASLNCLCCVREGWRYAGAATTKHLPGMARGTTWTATEGNCWFCSHVP